MAKVSKRYAEAAKLVDRSKTYSTQRRGPNKGRGAKKGGVPCRPTHGGARAR